MTIASPALDSDSQSDSGKEPRVSMSDYAEWARENNFDDGYGSDILNMQDDLLGLGPIQ